MASISEAYGSNYQEKSCAEAIMSNARLMSNNIINRKFTFRYSSNAMWSGANMKQEGIKALITLTNRNQGTRIKHISKTGPGTSMFPYLINGPVEYFVVVDLKSNPTKLYSIYITPTLTEAF